MREGRDGSLRAGLELEGRSPRAPSRLGCLGPGQRRPAPRGPLHTPPSKGKSQRWALRARSTESTVAGEPEALAARVCGDFHPARQTPLGPGAGPKAAHKPGAFCQPGDLEQGSSPSGLGVLPVKGCSLGVPPAAAPGPGTRALAPVALAELVCQNRRLPSHLADPAVEPCPEMKEKGHFRGWPRLANSGTSGGNEPEAGGAGGRREGSCGVTWSRAPRARGRKEEGQGQLPRGFDECAESASSHLQSRSVNVLSDRHTRCSPFP